MYLLLFQSDYFFIILYYNIVAQSLSNVFIQILLRIKILYKYYNYIFLNVQYLETLSFFILLEKTKLL